MASGVMRPVATSYGDMTSALEAEMAAQVARMGQLAIDVENLKTRNALLEAQLANVSGVRAPAHRETTTSLQIISYKGLRY